MTLLHYFNEIRYVIAHVTQVILMSSLTGMSRDPRNLMIGRSSNVQFIERSWWPSGLVVGLPSYGPGAGMSLPLGDEDHSPLGIE